MPLIEDFTTDLRHHDPGNRPYRRAGTGAGRTVQRGLPRHPRQTRPAPGGAAALARGHRPDGGRPGAGPHLRMSASPARAVLPRRRPPHPPHHPHTRHPVPRRRDLHHAPPAPPPTGRRCSTAPPADGPAWAQGLVSGVAPRSRPSRWLFMSRSNHPYRLIWDQNRADRPRRSVSVSSVFQVGSDRTAWIRTVLRYPIWVSVQQRPLPAGWRTRSICWDGAPTRTVRRGGHPGTCRRSYDTRAAGLAALNTDPASLTSAGVRARGTQRNARRDSREAVRSVRTRRIASVPNSMMNTPIVDEGTSWSRRPRQRWCGCQRPVR
jgi:hypothetical protein